MSATDAILQQHLLDAPAGLELSCSRLLEGRYHACWVGSLQNGMRIAALGMGPTREAAIVAASLTLERALLCDAASDLGNLGVWLPRGQA